MEKLFGQIDGLSRRQCDDLHALRDISVARSDIVTRELAEAMLAISEEIRREVAVFIDRSGQVLMVSVGQADKAPVLALSKRRWQYGYAGVRCVHTHPGATAHLSEPDISALKNLRYDAMIAIARPEGKLRASVAMLEPVDGMLADARVVGAEDLDWATFTRLPLADQLLHYEGLLARQSTVATGSEKERVILILQPKGNTQDDVEIAREELCELADTAGLDVVNVIVQVMRGNQHKLGAGKLEEIAVLVQNEAADVVVFDQALTPSYNQML